MAKYKCIPCGYIYDDEKEGTPFAELADDWACPVCGVDKTQFEELAE